MEIHKKDYQPSMTSFSLLLKVKREGASLILEITKISKFEASLVLEIFQKFFDTKVFRPNSVSAARNWFTISYSSWQCKE